MNFFIFLGPPGSGKGTQAQILSCNNTTYHHISTGQLLRDVAKTDSPLSEKIKATLSSGTLVADEIIFEALSSYILELKDDKDIILDGFPRTIEQASFFQEYIKSTGNFLKKVVYFHLDDNALLERITGRFSCASCGTVYHSSFNMPKVADACDFCNSKKFLKRDDDSVEVVQKRLVSYYKQTEPLINYYNNIGLLEEIDASLPVHILEKKLSSIIEDKQIKQ